MKKAPVVFWCVVEKKTIFAFSIRHTRFENQTPMKKITAFLVALFFCLGMANAQDVYFSGNGDGTGKIWKNNALIYSISDTTGIVINDMKVANDSTIFSAGRTFSDLQSHVWLNDSVVFSTDSPALKRIVIGSNGWMAS